MRCLLATSTQRAVVVLVWHCHYFMWEWMEVAVCHAPFGEFAARILLRDDGLPLPHNKSPIVFASTYVYYLFSMLLLGYSGMEVVVVWWVTVNVVETNECNKLKQCMCGRRRHFLLLLLFYYWATRYSYYYYSCWNSIGVVHIVGDKDELGRKWKDFQTDYIEKGYFKWSGSD